MRFGIREICNVVFRAKTKQTLGSRTFYKNEPVLYFDTLKTSNLEGAATTVYAQGGPGNPRLIAWEGERTLTFTMEDALLSPEGLAILTGAGLIAAKDANSGKGMFVHTTDTIEVKDPNTIVLPKDFACWTGGAVGSVRTGETIAEYQDPAADIFIMVMDDEGNIKEEPCIPAKVEYAVKDGHPQTTITCYGHTGKIDKNTVVFVDYYVRRVSKATQVEITADKFGGSYYIEADTLFRRQGDNYDMPATFVIPNGKVQSNFTFAMAATGDPSTFTFTVDAMPDYTKFDRTHKILAGILIIEDEDEEDQGSRETCFPVVSTDAVGVTVNTIRHTETETEYEVTGSNVKENAKDNLTFNADKQINSVNAIVASVPLDSGLQVVRQVNPALSSYAGNENIYLNSSGKYVKTKEYDVTNNGTPYEFLITNSTTPITIEIYDGRATIDSSSGAVDGTLKKTFIINPKVTIIA